MLKSVMPNICGIFMFINHDKQAVCGLSSSGRRRRSRRQSKISFSVTCSIYWTVWIGMRCHLGLVDTSSSPPPTPRMSEQIFPMNSCVQMHSQILACVCVCARAGVRMSAYMYRERGWSDHTSWIHCGTLTLVSCKDEFANSLGYTRSV